MPFSPFAPGVSFLPFLWYAITAKDTNEDCTNYNQTFDIPECYSNDGANIVVECGLCSQLMTITMAQLLDPQPVVS